MNHTTTINKLWEQFENAIETAYDLGDTDTRAALSDYREVSWSRDLEKLVEREAVNERQHRRGAPAGYKATMSAFVAAKLLLMNNAAEGSKKEKMPPATIFLNFRQTAAEGIVIGFLCRETLTKEWREAVTALDYAKIMNGGQ